MSSLTLQQTTTTLHYCTTKKTTIDETPYRDTTTITVAATQGRMPVALELAKKARASISPNPVARLYRSVLK